MSCEDRHLQVDVTLDASGYARTTVSFEDESGGMESTLHKGLRGIGIQIPAEIASCCREMRAEVAYLPKGAGDVSTLSKSVTFARGGGQYLCIGTFPGVCVAALQHLTLEFRGDASQAGERVVATVMMRQAMRSIGSTVAARRRQVAQGTLGNSPPMVGSGISSVAAGWARRADCEARRSFPKHYGRVEDGDCGPDAGHGEPIEFQRTMYS